MPKQKTVILDTERINWKIRRMAYEIWERFSNEQSVTLISVKGGGDVVADSLAVKLKEISGINIHRLSLQINKRKPLASEITIEENLDNAPVVLVDDVANSGKTLLYALTPVLKYSPKKIIIAVLVDRRHKSFPITPDIVGHSISTTLQEHIVVETEGDKVTTAYLE